MTAFETASSGIHSTPGSGAPDGADVASWLLDGRFFTIDTAGAITSWPPLAAETFGWRRQDAIAQRFVGTLIAPHAREEADAAVEAVFAGSAGGGAGYTGEVDALDVGERPLRAAFAMVPIQLGAGYEFNSLLQEISARARDDGSAADLKARHDSVLALIERALGGKLEGADYAGALVVFAAGPAVPGAQSVASDGALGDNVVSIAEAGGSEEARSQLERARRDAEAGRIEVRSLQGQLEEARREAQRSRAESDMARQEAGDARDALAVSQRESEELRRQLDDARHAIDEVRSAAEAARIRSEEAQRESDSLRDQLREARENVRGMAGRADEELAHAQERAALAERELAEVRAEAARNEAEVAPLRERYQVAQRELGTLRADLESAQAAVSERGTLGDRRAAELERMRSALEERTGELAAAHREKDQLSTQLYERAEELTAVREELDGRVAEVNAVRAQLDRTQEALEIARTGVHTGGVDRDAVGVEPDRPAPEPEPPLFELEDAAAGLTGEAMRRALEDDLFQLHCQPVLDLRTGTVTQYELLIRMTGEDGRLILPQAFLGTARRAGLAHAIDRWVVRRAIGLLHETALAGNPVSLEVNLSPEAVHDHDLPLMIDQELAVTPIDPSRLVLEVTGATASESLEETRMLAKRLRGLGCRFALDDFRSNFGSFRLLRDLPLDYLKLDGELVGSLAESRTSQLIVKALVDVAAGAGMKTVAVFVSDEETLRLLREQGVDYAQGYAVGRPRPVADALSPQPSLAAAQLPAG